MKTHGAFMKNFNLKPVESYFSQHPYKKLDLSKPKTYYDALQASTDRSDSAPFIRFILQMILDAILSSDASDQDTAQASDQVKRLIQNMEQKEYNLTELMALLDLSHRATFQKNYLTPALEVGVIERTLPEKPKSPKQK